MKWNGKFCSVIFRFFPEAILYPALDQKNLDLGIPNPKMKLLWRVPDSIGAPHSISFRVVVNTLINLGHHINEKTFETKIKNFSHKHLIVIK